MWDDHRPTSTSSKSSPLCHPKDSTSLSFGELPPEILHDILRYLEIPDILQLRRVSRYFNSVSRCRDVWSDAYREAEFVCPPGPFLSQSAHDLEGALVPSFRANRNLRHGSGGPCGFSGSSAEMATREIQTIKFREIRYTGLSLRVSLVYGGRFLLVALDEEVRCYDLSLDTFDSNSGASIIYRPTDGTLTSFHCVSAIDVEGRPFACAVMTETTQMSQDMTQISIYSLDVTESSEVTLDLLHQFDYGAFFHVEHVDLGPRVIVIHGRVCPNIGAGWHIVALDVHTRTQLLLPSFIHATWEADEMPESTAIEEITSPTSISTSTHLVLARSFYTQAAGWCTFVLAFALPGIHCHVVPISTSTSAPLNPSHRGILPGIDLRDAVLLHDATLDPSMNDVLITLRVHAFELSRPRSALSKYGVIRLSHRNRNRQAQAPHMSQDNGDGEDSLDTATFRLLGPLERLSGTRAPFLHPSFNGVGRAFYTREPGPCGIIAALEYNVRDSGGDEPGAARVMEYPCVLRLPTPRTLLDYDPYSGRMCLRSAMAKYSVIEIVDLAI